MLQLVCENLVLGYDSKPVVSDLSFSVSEGDYLFVVGENGSGKTTLMRTILGLSSPISGSIVFGGGVSRKKIGYLPQRTFIQKDFPASVKEIVMSGCLNNGKFRPFYSAEQKKRAADIIERIGISSISDSCFSELSGGQQQRVLLSRALCSTGKMLILDEPVAGLDPEVTEEMYDIIASLNKKDKITVIMISHDIVAALKYATHILHIGSPIFYGTKEEYINNDSYGLFKSRGDEK